MTNQMHRHYFNNKEIDLLSYETLNDDFLHNSGLTIEVINKNLEVIYTRGKNSIPGKKYSFKQLLDRINLDTWTEFVTHKVYLDEEGNENIILFDQSIPETELELLRNEAAYYIGLMIMGILLISTGFSFFYFKDIYGKLSREFLYIQEKITKIPHLQTRIESDQFQLIEARELAEAYNQTVKEMEMIKKVNAEIQENSNQLITNLSHDIKSPLTCLTGYTALLGEKYNNTEKINEYFGYIDNSVKDLNNIVSMLFEQVQSRHTETLLKRGDYDINEVLREVCANYYIAFTRAGFNVEIDIEEESRVLYIDRINMKRVFNNILDNCLKHNENPTDVLISSEMRNGEIVINFMNNGISITEDVKASIFMPYYYNNYSNKKGPSSGLGLNIAKEILEKHGGSIILTDNDRFTTVFRIMLPAT
ncbi:MAG: HAMP domain-containing histidine kinase [Spirochaetales bacterium]|nr:HAMP domain-containing histidine kinase [Spirochaetales bacterium]